ncbi:hypothetical protein Hesp01_17600 [Herbidospora sp. NBRC 101105]|nr:hypothetical protein Hesp01_17600 [Herbidospora sp. NBRC 101105]
MGGFRSPGGLGSIAGGPGFFAGVCGFREGGPGRFREAGLTGRAGGRGVVVGQVMEKPPSTQMFWPVTKAAASEARKTAMPA